MSGKPNEVDVSELRQRAARIKELDNEIARLGYQIDRDTKAIEFAKAERYKDSARVLELLRQMDVASNGNTGWEARVVWFLAELTTQAEHHGRTYQ